MVSLSSFTHDVVYLTDLAAILLTLGCVDALNGDGGGSSYMWPDDNRWGRKLGTALIVKKGVGKDMRLNDIQVSKNFKLYEFECKSTGEVKLDPKLLELAQKLRDRIGPVKINSSYRTHEHNKAIGGSPNSQHMLGKAMDVSKPSNMTIDQLAAHGKSVGFTGIGKYPWGCHFDVRVTPTNWDFRKGGADQ